MKDLNLNEALRYVLAGGTALVFSRMWFTDSPTMTKLEELAAGAGLSLVLGALIYAIHRAVLYPLLYYGIARCTYGKGTRLMDLDVARWKRQTANNNLQGKFGEWASQAHFLYCVVWALGAALISGVLLRWTPRVGWCWPGAVGVLLLFVALWHHYRYLHYEKYCATMRVAQHGDAADAASPRR